jgi:hypothetical protein
VRASGAEVHALSRDIATAIEGEEDPSVETLPAPVWSIEDFVHEFLGWWDEEPNDQAAARRIANDIWERAHPEGFRPSAQTSDEEQPAADEVAPVATDPDGTALYWFALNPGDPDHLAGWYFDSGVVRARPDEIAQIRTDLGQHEDEVTITPLAGHIDGVDSLRGKIGSSLSLNHSDVTDTEMCAADEAFATA